MVAYGPAQINYNKYIKNMLFNSKNAGLIQRNILNLFR